jgi:hypothetical protein
MKKSIILIAIIIIFISIISLIIFNKNIQLSKEIINYCDKQKEDIFELKLSDYTKFEWDNVIIYKNTISNKELSEFLGIDYKKGLDLKSGMIFIKDNKIVYEEYFKTDFESPYKFVIYPYEDINSKNKINKFTKEKSVFKVERIKYNNENRYKLTPIE